MPHLTTNQSVIVTKEELKKGIKFCVTENNILIETYNVFWAQKPVTDNYQV